MPSLSPERLAALVDEPPTAEERALLAASPALAAELAAMTRIVALAAYERTHPGPPLTGWGTLSAALREEGLVTSRTASVDAALPASASPAPFTVAAAPRVALARDGGALDLDAARAARARALGAPRRPAWAMAAAAALLVTLGVAGGRWSASRGDVPVALPTRPPVVVDGDGAPLASPAPDVAAQPVASALPTGDTMLAAPASPRSAVPYPSRTDAALAAGTVPVTTRIATREQAVRTLQQLEEAHQQAVSWLAAHDSSVGNVTGRRIVGAAEMVRDLRRQIEVLDAAVAMGRRALYESPDDPVMNRYYFAALAAREVLLRKLAAALPASQQVLEY